MENSDPCHMKQHKCQTGDLYEYSLKRSKDKELVVLLSYLFPLIGFIFKWALV